MAEVTANGVGNLLKFGYWTTDGKDTLLSVTNLSKDEETVNVKVVSDMGVVAGTITVCLGASDTVTAAIVASEDGMGSTVMIGSPGSCSTDMMAPATLPLMSGLIEVYPVDMEGYLMGTATLVNSEAGHASSYNATSLMADLDSEDMVKGARHHGCLIHGRWYLERYAARSLGCQCNDRRNDADHADLPCP